jgi:hypothetical protein
MEYMLLFGRLTGFGGVLLCAFTALARLSGRYSIGDFSLGVLFQAGTAATVVGCFCLLMFLVERAKSAR